MTLQNGHNNVVSLQQVLPRRITLADALEFSRTLAKHNPFVRLAPEKQEIANKAHAVIQRKVKQEAFEALEDALF